jgi:hypothetical protein
MSLIFSFKFQTMMWNSKSINDFLKIFKQHPLLWNTLAHTSDYAKSVRYPKMLQVLYPCAIILLVHSFQN